MLNIVCVDEWVISCALCMSGNVIIVWRESTEAVDGTDAAGRGGDAVDKPEDDKESSHSPDIELCTHLLTVSSLDNCSTSLKLSILHPYLLLIGPHGITMRCGFFFFLFSFFLFFWRRDAIWGLACVGSRKHVLGGVKVGRIHSPPRGVTSSNLDTRVSCAKTGQLIEMPCVGWLMWAQGTIY